MRWPDIRLLRLITLLVAGTLMSPGLSARTAWALQSATCEHALRSLADAITTRDRLRLEREGFEIGALPGCDPDEVRPRRTEAARVLERLVREARAAGADPAEIRERYLAARRVAPVAAVLQGLADLAYAERRWSEAARYYNDLLLTLEDPEPGDASFAPAALTTVYQRASESQMLAPIKGLSVRTSRDGAPGGLDAVLVPNASRRLVVRPRLLPVTFEFNSAEMTPEGRAFAEEWWNAVRSGIADALVLAGHTDPRGSDAHNEALAIQRAAAMAAFLRRHGFEGRMLVVGFGRRCPVDLSAGSNYTREEQFQIFRRVEVIAGRELPTGYCREAGPATSIMAR